MDSEEILRARVIELEEVLQKIADHTECDDYYHDWCGCLAKLCQIASNALGEK